MATCIYYVYLISIIMTGLGFVQLYTRIFQIIKINQRDEFYKTPESVIRRSAGHSKLLPGTVMSFIIHAPHH